MKDAEAKKGTRQDDRNKKPSGLRDYFDWMVRYAQKQVGSNDARAVANEALHDAFRSNRPKPPVDNEQATRRWLSCLIIWRARDYRKREKRWKVWDLRGLETMDDKPQSDVLEHSDVVLDRIELTRALEGLTPDDRRLFLEYYLGRSSPRELAAKRAMSEKMLRDRVARVTDQLVAMFHGRPKKSRRWRGMVFFLESFPERRFGDGFIDMVRAWSSRSSGAMKWLGACASSAAMCMLMSGDVAARQPIPEPVPDVPANNEKSGEMPSLWFFSTIEKAVYAIPDKHQPIPVAPAVAPEKPAPAISPDPPQPAPKTEMYAPNPAEACAIAFGQAQTEYHHRQNAQACLDELNRIPTGFSMCRDTPARAALRLSCETSLSRTK